MSDLSSDPTRGVDVSGPGPDVDTSQMVLVRRADLVAHLEFDGMASRNALRAALAADPVEQVEALARTIADGLGETPGEQHIDAAAHLLGVGCLCGEHS